MVPRNRRRLQKTQMKRGTTIICADIHQRERCEVLCAAKAFDEQTDCCVEFVPIDIRVGFTARNCARIWWRQTAENGRLRALTLGEGQ